MTDFSLFEYSAYLIFDVLPEEEIQKIRSVAENFNLELDIGSDYLEFEYSGRDTERQILIFLCKIAKVIGDAKGEIRCEKHNDEIDPLFEFLKITGGNLLLQKGRIVRENKHKIVDL